MKLASHRAGRGRLRFGAWMVCGLLGLAMWGWLALPRPLAVSGGATTLSAAEEPAEEPEFEREVLVVYSVNNLGYIDTCG